MKTLLKVLAVLVIAAPVTFFGTFLLSPFWDWFETATGIESYGHSGPADWCFMADYAVLVVVVLGVWWFRSHRNRQ